MATSKTGTSSIIIATNKLEEEVTANEYLMQLKNALEEVDTLEYQCGDIYQTEICGEKYEIVELKVNNYAIVQHHYAKIEDNELITIVITASSSDEINEILNWFTTE